MPKLTYDDGGTPRHQLSEHEIAMIMTALRMAGKPNDFPEQIQYEYSRTRDWLHQILSQPESRSPEPPEEDIPNG